MIENYRSELIWRLFMQNARVQQALQKAGIGEPALKEGFPFVVADSKTGVVDLIAHPDNEKYQLDCYSSQAGNARISIKSGSTMETIQEYEVPVTAGVFRFCFDDTKVTRGKKHQITLTLPSGKTCQMETVLH